MPKTNNTTWIQVGLAAALAVTAYAVLSSAQSHHRRSRRHHHPRHHLGQSHSLLYPTQSIHPQLPVSMQPIKNAGRVYATAEYPLHMYDQNASSLLTSVHPGSDPQEHPEMSYAPFVQDGETGQALGNDPQSMSLKHTPKEAQRLGFAVATWDAGRQGGAEIVYLGKALMFERYPVNASAQGLLKLGSGAEKVSTPYLPYIGWDGMPWYAKFSTTGSGTFVVYPATDPDAATYTRSIEYLTPSGDRRVMTKVPTATRVDTPTVQRQRTDDKMIVSDFPLVFRVTRNYEHTILDTSKLYVMNWDRKDVVVEILPDRRFQLKHALNGRMLSEPSVWFDYLDLNGTKKSARVREGNALQFLTLDHESQVQGVEDSLSFLGPREEYFEVRLLPLRDSLETAKYHIQ